MIQSFQAIIFDLDGVIIDSEPMHAQAKRVAFEEYEMDVPEEVYEQFVGETDYNVVKFVVQNYGDTSVSVQEVLDAKQAEFRALIPRMKAIPGALEFIQKARKYYENMVLVTSATSLNERLSLERFGLSDTFDFTINVEDVKNAKPDPEPYTKAIERLDIAAENCLIVEDSLNGVTAARHAGAFVVAVQTSMTEDRLFDAGADKVFTDFSTFHRWHFGHGKS